MKPTNFLKKSFREAVQDRAITIQYSRFEDVPGNTDAFGEIEDVYAAYTDPVSIPVLVDLMPSSMLRKEFGDEAKFDIVVTMVRDEASDQGFTPEKGDRIMLPDDEKPWFVVRVKPGKQVHSEHIEYRLACARKEAWQSDIG